MVATIINTGCQSKTDGKADPREANRVIDSPSVAYLQKLDKENKDAVFVTTKDFPELKGLNNKVISIKPLNQDLSINYDEYLHKDYMGPIYILLPSYYIGIRASVILKCFPAYKGFALKELSDNYALYYTDQKR
ncbi:hypothetical protein BC343_10570 [Mucilaginibacter pedocola]|uniref:Uncharacterized protein n=1 Tax=Mucilaginibacter pedocola TaxID=1792845 RepID=A0A1S9PAT3_9SPHI|nr:hypothetical protein BC343_10570 [Mucilaginibacter pedocola]